jgi:hypothetical protein
MAGGGADRANGARRGPHPILLLAPVPDADRHSSWRSSPRHSGGGHPHHWLVKAPYDGVAEELSRRRLLRGMARGIATVGAAAGRRRGAAVPSAGGWEGAVAGGGARGAVGSLDVASTLMRRERKRGF